MYSVAVASSRMVMLSEPSLALTHGAPSGFTILCDSCARSSAPVSERMANESCIPIRLRRRRVRCLGKMRQKVAGQFVAFEQRGGGLARKLAHVANEVRLVVIAARQRRLHPVAARFDLAEHALKTLDPAEELGAYADLRLESPLQLARADGKTGDALAAKQTPDGLVDDRVERTQAGEQRAFELFDRTGVHVDGMDLVDDTVHRKVEDARRAVRVKAHADDLRRSGRAHQHRTGDLTREERARLGGPFAVPEGFKRRPQVDDQLAAAIRDNALHRGVVRFERPEAVQEGLGFG